MRLVVLPTILILTAAISSSSLAGFKAWRIEGEGESVSLQAFKKNHNLSTKEMRAKFGAAGRIMCPWGTATAFLIGKTDVFMTSDHLFLDIEKKAQPRGKIGKCTIKFFYSDKSYQVDANSVIHGFKTNKTAYRFDWFDWAAGKLRSPVVGVTPFQIGPDDFDAKMPVAVLSQGMKDSIPRVCRGLINAVMRVATINEFTTNCSTGSGSSGGPILIGSGKQPADVPVDVVGLTYGWTDPYFKPVGPSHRAVPIGDKFVKEALKKLLAE